MKVDNDLIILQPYALPFFTVVKANVLIQNSYFDMSALQQRLMLFIISKIQQAGVEYDSCEFTVTEFCEIVQIDRKSGENYMRIKKAVNEIANASVLIKNEHGVETLVHWIEKPYIDQRSGRIKVRLDQDIKPFLLNLKKNFTQCKLYYIMNLKSKYSIRLYELLKSYFYNPNEPFAWTFWLPQFKEQLSAQNYTTFNDFKRRCLIPAVEDINKCTDLTVQWYPEKRGRSIIGITFVYKKKALCV